MPSNADQVSEETSRLAASARQPWKVVLGFVALTATSAGLGSVLVESQGWPRWTYAGVSLLMIALATALTWLSYRQGSDKRSVTDNTVPVDIDYQAMFASHPTPMMFFHRKSLAIVQANQAAIDHYEYTSAQFRSLSVRDLYPSEDLELGQSISAARFIGVRRHVSRTGRVFEAEVHLRPATVTEASYDLLVALPKDATLSLEQTFQHLAQRFQAQPGDGFALYWLADRHGEELTLFPDIRGELGLSRESGLSFNRYIAAVHEGDREGVQRAWGHARQHGETVHHYRLRRENGDQYRAILERIVCAYDPHEGIHKLAGFSIEFSASMLLRGRPDHELYQRMIANTPDGVVIVHQEIIRFANPSACVLFAAEQEESAVLQGVNVRTLFHPDEAGREVDRLNALQHRSAEESRFRHVRLVRRDGRFFEAELSELTLDGPGGTSVQLLIRDISESAAMRRELQEANQRLQHLSQRLIEIQETERRQLARDLHDDIGQQLTGMKLHTQRLINRAATEEQKRIADLLTTRVDETLAKVRSLSLALHPLQLETLGLEAAVRWHLSQFLGDGAPRWDLQVRGNLEAVEPFQAVAAFRLIQEAVNNVARHAEAEEIRVRLLREDGHLEIEILDDGKGFDVTAAKTGASSLGLTSMEERVAALSGSLHIASLPGLGTRITARMAGKSEPSVERRYKRT